MTPKQRFMAAVNGEKIDQIPVTAWVHFASDHLSGRETALLHQRFQDAYNWDLIKVMGDYRYPVPASMRLLSDPAQLREFEPVGLDHPAFAEQLKCLHHLRAAYGDDVPLVDTAFDPYQSIVRNIGRDQQQALWDFKDETLRALEIVCDTICAYIRELKRIGVEGYFYSMNSCIPEGEPRGTSDEVYETFLRPFDLRILEEAEGMVRILHAHGTGLDMKRMEGYPFEVLNMSDRAENNPGLAELRKITDACLMGGLNENTVPDIALSTMEKEIDAAIQEAGTEGFILAAGCTLPSYVPVHSLEHLRDYTRSIVL